MAQIVVDSSVMRSKADTIEQQAQKILELYNEMKNIVDTTAGKMKGTTIETQKQRFGSMQSAFQNFYDDMLKYSQFLNQAAEAYEAAEAAGTSAAEEQGQIF